MRFRDKVVVTGSSSGVGPALAIRRAAEGAAALLGCRRQEALAETAALFEGDGTALLPVRPDVNVPEAVPGPDAAAEEVANLAALLVSGDAAAITGAVYALGGGWLENLSVA